MDLVAVGPLVVPLQHLAPEEDRRQVVGRIRVGTEVVGQSLVVTGEADRPTVLVLADDELGEDLVGLVVGPDARHPGRRRGQDALAEQAREGDASPDAPCVHGVPEQAGLDLDREGLALDFCQLGRHLHSGVDVEHKVELAPRLELPQQPGADAHPFV